MIWWGLVCETIWLQTINLSSLSVWVLSVWDGFFFLWKCKNLQSYVTNVQWHLYKAFMKAGCCVRHLSLMYYVWAEEDIFFLWDISATWAAAFIGFITSTTAPPGRIGTRTSHPWVLWLSPCRLLSDWVVWHFPSDYKSELEWVVIVNMKEEQQSFITSTQIYYATTWSLGVHQTLRLGRINKDYFLNQIKSWFNFKLCCLKL